MASGKPTPDAPGLTTTRQMLDELDALMERMLALPVNDTEDPPPAPMPPASPVLPPLSPPTAPLAAKLTLLQVPVEEPLLDPPHPGTNPSHLPTLNALPAPAAAPTPPVFSDRVLPPVLVPSDASLPEPPEPPDAVESWFILPLLWGNRLFDRGTLLLGESGGWLRSSAGRGVLGVTGIGLLVVAGVWLLRDWLGLTW